MFGERKPFDLPIPRRAARTDPFTDVIDSGFVMRAAVYIYQRGKIGEKRGVGGSEKIKNVRHV